jgi:cytochrome c2
MLRTWVIAGIALAASSGPTLAQDAAAGEQVFKRLCSPCHEIGQDAKIKLGPPLNGIDGRKSGTGRSARRPFSQGLARQFDEARLHATKKERSGLQSALR